MINLAQDRGKWWAVVNAIINVPFPQRAEQPLNLDSGQWSQ